MELIGCLVRHGAGGRRHGVCHPLARSMHSPSVHHPPSTTGHLVTGPCHRSPRMSALACGVPSCESCRRCNLHDRPQSGVPPGGASPDSLRLSAHSPAQERALLPSACEVPASTPRNVREAAVHHGIACRSRRDTPAPLRALAHKCEHALSTHAEAFRTHTQLWDMRRAATRRLRGVQEARLACLPRYSARRHCGAGRTPGDWI